MIRVMLINDYQLISSLISASLYAEPQIQVVKTCTPDDDLVAAIRETPMDVLLISGELSARTTVDLVAQIDALNLPLNMVILGLDDRGQSILPYLEAGAIGYVLKDASVDDLVNAIISAHQQQAQISPQMARTLIERVYRLASEFQSLDTSLFERVELTTRELQVLELLNENLSNTEIAARLFVQVGTVKNHVHSILKKLEVNSRQDAVKYLALLRNQ